MATVSASAIAAGRKMLGERLDKLDAKDFAKPALQELTKYLLDLVEHQIERKLNAREMLESAG